MLSTVSNVLIIRFIGVCSICICVHFCVQVRFVLVPFAPYSVTDCSGLRWLQIVSVWESFWFILLILLGQQVIRCLGRRDDTVAKFLFEPLACYLGYPSALLGYLSTLRITLGVSLS